MVETTRVRLWQIRKTEMSILFSTMPPGDGGREVFIPRSLMTHISRDLPLKNGWVPCTVDVELWKAEQLEL